MLVTELIPNLTHCIEMVAKREYAWIPKQLLAPREANKERQILDVKAVFTFI
ncbi:hypothetical protein ACFLTK_01415 [Chloroflexota bacterium]